MAKEPNDPDPFAETALDSAERQAMLTKIADHMRPRLARLTDEQKTQLRVRWDALRDQETVEGFRAHADALLAALDAPDTMGKGVTYRSAEYRRLPRPWRGHE